MKTFWKQTTIFIVLILLIIGIILGFFYTRGVVGSNWVVYQFSGEEYKTIGSSDIKEIKNIITDVQQTPATEEQIQEYTKTSEWTGFIFSDDETHTIYSFSSNLNILAVYKADDLAQSELVLAESISSIEPEQTQELADTIDSADFSFYQCTEEQLQKIQTIYNKYYE